jgi:hypothetical protein
MPVYHQRQLAPSIHYAVFIMGYPATIIRATIGLVPLAMAIRTARCVSSDIKQDRAICMLIYCAKNRLEWRAVIYVAWRVHAAEAR